MGMLRGVLAQRLILSLVALALSAIAIAVISILAVQYVNSALSQVAAQADIATQSSRIRAESVTLIDLAQRYTELGEADRRTWREKTITSQQYNLRFYLQRISDTLDPNDVAGREQLGDIEQKVQGFNAQLTRLMDTFDSERTVGPATSREMAVLIANYQNPLVDALSKFEGDESTKVEGSRNEARGAVNATVVGLIVSAVVVLMIMLITIQQALVRVVAPLAALRAGVESFRLGQFDEPVRVTGRDEMGMLASAFNGMATQLRELVSTLEQRVAHRTRDLEAAAQVAHATTSILDPAELLPSVVDLIRERFDLYYVGLFLLDPSGRSVVLRAGTGEAGRRMLAQRHSLQAGGASMIGRCVGSGEARIALDVGKEAVRFDNPLLPDTRSEMALPMRSRGRVIGAMTVQSAQEAAFDEADIAVVQTMADQVATAIDNAQLFAEARAALREMEATQRRYQIQAWVNYARTRTISGYEQTGAETKPLDQVLPQVQQAMAEQKPTIWSGDGDQGQPAESSSSGLVVPIMLRGLPIGALGFEDAEGKRQWGADEIALAETIAQQLALAVDNVRLFDETQRRAARERLVSEMTSRMRESLEVDRVLQTAVDDVYQAMGLDEAAIRLAPEEVGSDTP